MSKKQFYFKQFSEAQARKCKYGSIVNEHLDLVAIQAAL